MTKGEWTQPTAPAPAPPHSAPRLSLPFHHVLSVKIPSALQDLVEITATGGITVSFPPFVFLLAFGQTRL